jgi:5,10-methylenetetrahydrofolate reductase
VVLCDFSPPRSADPAAAEDARVLPADFICVAYNPGKAVRISSAVLAYLIRQSTGRDAVFNLGTRDMNKLALETLLLGARALGLENVLVVQGDPFSEQERERVKPVDDFTPTGLLSAIRDLNEGLDFRGSKLRGPVDICAGASIDLGRGIEDEARLAHRKVEAGARFFVTQPIFDVADRERFLDLYHREASTDMTLPVFWGLQVLIKDGVIFSHVPQGVRDDLERGRDGADIALELLDAYLGAGIDAIYLVPPILRGGARDYKAAGRVLEAINAGRG